MAEWKKVIVSGSSANLAALQVDNLTSGEVVIGGGTSNLSTTAVNGTGTIVATTGATGVSMTGSFTGSFVGDGSGLTGLVTTLSGSTDSGDFEVDLLTQYATISGTPNEVETSATGTAITIGLPSDVTIGNNLTVTGDLYVNGTTTTINTSELHIEDKFILLASGSASAGDGGIIIDRGSDSDANIAFGYDAATDRWGYQNGLTDTTNAITIGTDGNSAFAGYVFTEAAHTATKPTTGEFVVQGAMYTSNAGDIWVYA